MMRKNATEECSLPPFPREVLLVFKNGYGEVIGEVEEEEVDEVEEEGEEEEEEGEEEQGAWTWQCPIDHSRRDHHHPAAAADLCLKSLELAPDRRRGSSLSRTSSLASFLSSLFKWRGKERRKTAFKCNSLHRFFSGRE